MMWRNSWQLSDGELRGRLTGLAGSDELLHAAGGQGEGEAASWRGVDTPSQTPTTPSAARRTPPAAADPAQPQARCAALAAAPLDALHVRATSATQSSRPRAQPIRPSAQGAGTRCGWIPVARPPMQQRPGCSWWRWWESVERGRGEE
jgi:hypothetical protein